MAGTAVLDPDVLVDSLIEDVIDSLRGELHPEFGVRAYRVFTVLRTWSGGAVGRGSKTDTEVELLPQPRVDVWDGRKFEMATCGLDEGGDVRLSEVSLTYTHAELTRGLGSGTTLAANQQWLYRIAEANGQAQPSTYWVLSKSPFVDREKTLGWIVWLTLADVAR